MSTCFLCLICYVYLLTASGRLMNIVMQRAKSIFNGGIESFYVDIWLSFKMDIQTIGCAKTSQTYFYTYNVYKK